MKSSAKYFEARNIKKVTLNGKKMKIFQLWEKQPCGAKLFYGSFSAPVRTVNKNLVQHWLDNKQEGAE